MIPSNTRSVLFLLFTSPLRSFFFFFNDPPTTEISTLPLHAPLPIKDERLHTGIGIAPPQALDDPFAHARRQRIDRRVVDRDDGNAIFDRVLQELIFAHLCFQPEPRSEEHTSELQSQSNLVCRLLLEK